MYMYICVSVQVSGPQGGWAAGVVGGGASALRRSADIYIYIYVYTYVCIYIYMYVCVCICIYMYV